MSISQEHPAHKACNGGGNEDIKRTSTKKPDIHVAIFKPGSGQTGHPEAHGRTLAANNAVVSHLYKIERVSAAVK